MGGLAGSIAHGFSQLFKGWGRGIGKAVDNYLVGGAEARKAISDEVKSKFQPMIDKARGYESKRAANITELDKRLTESKKAFQEAQADWNKKYAAELAAAKAQRQTDIDNYNAQSKAYQDALNDAKAGRRDILDQLKDQENQYDITNTMFTDVKSGKIYIFSPFEGYKSIDNLTKKERKDFLKNYRNFDNRLFDSNSGNVINAFDKSAEKNYGKYGAFNAYKNRVQSSRDADIRNAENKIKLADADVRSWKSNPNKPTAWDETTQGNNDLTRFKSDFTSKNGSLPNEYNFNGAKYGSETDLEKAYQDALDHEQSMRDHFGTKASKAVSSRDAEIAKRIQDAKDIKKAKLVGAGALAAGAAAAMYGGDDTDNGDTTNTTDNIDNTADNIDAYTGEADPKLKAENTPEGNEADTGKSLVDTGSDLDDAIAALSQGAHDKGVEDGNAIRASDIVTADGQHIDDGLFELLKAMKDPHKADAIANYIYSKHGNDLDVQRLGWRAWLNRYGDSLRSKMGIDPSGYKGMHISGGL